MNIGKPLTRIGISTLRRGATVAIGGLAAGGLALRAASKITSGTAVTAPLAPPPSGAVGYGKRGIDANNLNTNGLVQSLHNSRRKFK